MENTLDATIDNTFDEENEVPRKRYVHPMEVQSPLSARMPVNRRSTNDRAEVASHASAYARRHISGLIGQESNQKD